MSIRAQVSATSRFEQQRLRALARGMRFLERAAERDPTTFGSGMLYCASFMGATCGDKALRTRARKLAAETFHRWRVQNAAGEGNPSELIAQVQHYDAASRIGLKYPGKVALLRAAAHKYSAAAFLWFDPRRESPPTDVPETCVCQATNARGARKCAVCGARLERMSATRVWFMGFTSAYCASKLGVKLGARYVDVMQWLPHMRRYRGPRAGLVPFYDSVYAATHVIYTLNDYGKFYLRPEWAPHEYLFLAKHLEHALNLNDPDMVGEFVDSLRAFGLRSEEPSIRYAMQYLLDVQNSDGSWGAREGRIDYRRFHATWAAMDGLREFTWKQPGLSFPILRPQLEEWGRYA